MPEGKKIEVRIAATGGAAAAAEIEKVERAVGSIDAPASTAAEGFESLAGKSDELAEAATKTGAKVGGMGKSLLALVGGPIGLASIAISAITRELLKWKKALDDWKAAQEAANDKYNEFAQSLIDRQRDLVAANRVQEQSTARTREWAAAQAQAISDIRGINDVLARNIELLEEQQAAQEEIAKARDRLRMQEAGDDPVKREEAAASARQEAQQRKIENLAARRRQLQDDLDRAEQEQIAMNEQGMGEVPGQMEAEAKKRKAAAADAQMQAQALREEAKRIEVGTGRGAAGRQREKNTLNERARKFEQEANSLEQEAKDLDAIAKQARADFTANINAIVAEMNRLFKEIQKIDRATATKSEVFDVDNQAGDLRLQRAREAAAEKDKREAERAERTRLQAEIKRREEALNADARAAGLGLREKGLRGGNDTAAAVGKALADGTNAAELQKLGDQVKEAMTTNTRAQTAYMLDMIAKLNAATKEIEVLRTRIRNTP
jgi:hypothetical protein